MSIRVSALVLMASLALATGCPGGDGDGDGEAGTGNAGASGAGHSGTGGHSGASGASGTGGTAGGGGGGATLTPEQAMAGLCDSMGEDSMGQCTEYGGLDEYTTCANEMCMLDECTSGPCAADIDCYQTADDPCTCELSAACQQCYTDKGTCAFNNCIELITCDGEPIFTPGETTDGGACDQLEACCMTLTDPQTMQACTLASTGLRSVGDSACEGAIMSLCPMQ